MFQFNMNVDKRHSEWLACIEKVLKLQLKALDGVFASADDGVRLMASVAVERQHKAEAKKIIKNVLAEMFLTVVKFEYLCSKVKIPKLDEDSYNILIHTLVSFDREAESDIVLAQLKIRDMLSLDGFFNFRLGELRERWDEIAELASNNAFFLGQEETLNELLKFLMSAVTPKIKKLSVEVKENDFLVKGNHKNSQFEFRVLNSMQLMIYLINVAPLELILEGEFADKGLYKRIVSIFDGKSG